MTVPHNIHLASQPERSNDFFEGKSLEIRRMELKDLDRVYELETMIFKGPWSRENFRQEIHDRSHSICLVAELDGKVVGYSVSYLVTNELHILNLAVAPLYRRKNIGENLLRRMLEIAKQNGCQWAHLEVRRSNRAAIELYQKFGFTVIGIRKGYYALEKEDAILMYKDF